MTGKARVPSLPREVQRVAARLPQHPLLVRLYLRLRPSWRLLGRQFLIVGKKP